jgi:hypothetical protein
MPEIVGQDEGSDADPISHGGGGCQRGEGTEAAREVVGHEERVIAKGLDSAAFLSPVVARASAAKLDTKAKRPVRQQRAPDNE